MFNTQLRQTGGHIPTLCRAYSEWIKTTSILVQEYIANCALAVEALWASLSLDDDERETIEEYLHYPYEHVERQRQYLRQLGMDQQQQRQKLEMDVVCECDAIESELYECALLIKDNLMVNLLPGVRIFINKFYVMLKIFFSYCNVTTFYSNQYFIV